MIYKLYRLTLWIQGIYTLATAIWGLVHIESFMWVTGPKTNIWLVKTVSVVLVAVAVCLLSFLFLPSHPLPPVLLGGLTAAGLAFIDIYYVLTDTIRWVYLLDAVAEILFFLLWLFLVFNHKVVYEKTAAQNNKRF